MSVTRSEGSKGGHTDVYFFSLLFANSNFAVVFIDRRFLPLN